MVWGGEGLTRSTAPAELPAAGNGAGLAGLSHRCWRIVPGNRWDCPESRRKVILKMAITGVSVRSQQLIASVRTKRVWIHLGIQFLDFRRKSGPRS